jgi:hypothetical protein
MMSPKSGGRGRRTTVGTVVHSTHEVESGSNPAEAGVQPTENSDERPISDPSPNDDDHITKQSAATKGISYAL